MDHRTRSLVVVFAILTAASVRPASGASSWMPVAFAKYDFEAVAFADPAVGIVVGLHGFILRTSDGGGHWLPVVPDTRADLAAITWLGPDTALIVGNGGTILRSVDRGISWTAVASGTDNPLRCIGFSNHRSGVVLGLNGTQLRTTDAGASWSVRTDDSLTGIDLYGVQFLDDSVGVCTGDHYILRTTDGGAHWRHVAYSYDLNARAIAVCGENSFILVGQKSSTYNSFITRSSDRGITWHNVLDDNRFTLLLTCVQCVSGSRGYALGNGNFAFRTDDGGATWTRLIPTMATGSTVGAVKGIWMTGSEHGFAARTGSVLCETVDGFQTCTFGHMIPDAHIRSIVSSAAPRALAVGDSGLICWTNDHGGSWRREWCTEIRSWRCVTMPDSIRALMFADSGRFAASTDGGIHWAPAALPVSAAIDGVAFPTRTLGWAVGTGGAIVHTTDAGAAWSAQSSGATTDLHAVGFRSATAGVAVGDSGIVLRTTNGGATWVRSASTSIATLRAVALVSDSIVIAAGASGVICRSSDGGATWDTIPRQTFEDLHSVAMANGVIYAAGMHGTVLRSSDAGRSWRRNVSGTVADLYAVAAVAKDTVLAGGDGAVIFRTATGGMSNQWDAVYDIPSYRQIVALCVDDSLHVAAFDDKLTVLRTASGGAYWFRQSPVALQLLPSVSAIARVDRRRWIAPLNSSYTPNPLCESTSDGGITWFTSIPTSGNASLNWISIPFGDTVFTAGSGGMFFATFDGGVHWDDLSDPADSLGTVSTGAFRDGKNGFVSCVLGRASRTTDGGHTWSRMAVNETRQMNGAAWVSSSLAIMVGDSGTVLRTTDSGATWVHVDPGTNAWLKTVMFFTPLKGWILGGGGVALLSTDGGATWLDRSLPTSNTLLSAAAFGSRRLCVGGTHGAIYTTTDDGISWTASGAPTMDGLTSVEFADDRHGLAVGDNGVVLKTSDAGASWSSMRTRRGDMLLGVALADTGAAVAVGSAGGAMRTLDGGATWIPAAIPATDTLRCVTRAGPQAFVAAGNSGAVVRSTDSGISWNELGRGTTHTLSGLSFLSPDYGWVVGESTNLHTTNGGASWQAQVASNSMMDICAVDSLTVIGLEGYIKSYNTKPGWVTEHHAIINRSTNAGTSWTTLLDEMPWKYGLTARGADVLVVGNPNYEMGFSGLIESADTGKTWSGSFSSVGMLRAGRILGANSACAVGEYGTIARKWRHGDSPALSLSPRTMYFAESVTGGSRDSVWLMNEGGDTITPHIRSSSNPQFAIDEFSRPLPPHTMIPIVIAHTASASNDTGVVAITTADGQWNDTLRLYGAAWDATATPLALDFGSIPTLTARTLGVTFRNLQSTTVAIRVDSFAHGPFSIAPVTSVVAAGDSIRILTTYHPLTDGASSDTLVIKYAPLSSALRIPLRGEAYTPPLGVRNQDDVLIRRDEILDVFPNPVSGIADRVTVRFRTADAGAARIELCDVLGRVVSEQECTCSGGITNEQGVELSGRSSEMLFCRLRTVRGVTLRSIVAVR